MEDAIAPRLDRGTELLVAGQQADRLRHACASSRSSKLRLRQRLECMFELRPSVCRRVRRGGLRAQIVLDDESPDVRHALCHLCELQAQQLPVVTELHEPACGLGSDPHELLRRLEDRYDVADGDGVLQLERRERGEGNVESLPEALERLKALRGAVHHPPDSLQNVALGVPVDGDEVHRCGNRDDRARRSNERPAPPYGAWCRSHPSGRSRSASGGRSPERSVTRRTTR